MKKILTILLFLLITNGVSAEQDLRSMFLNNKSIICAINIRTFNAKDSNKNDLIDKNEQSGNFINAIERLDEIKDLNINTLHLLPITPIGKLKALGTAGSLYSISDFTSINPQLIDKNSDLTAFEQVKLFVNEAHKRNIKVIVDLPSCGAYDLFLSNPELFIKNRKQLSIIPTDWTDVRLLDTGTNEALNQDLLELHKRFIDMALDLGFDGIRADVATIKPFNFWKELIDYTREKKPNFLYLAEASDSWRESPSRYAEFTPYDKLLLAGFDGYYGSFFNLKDWKSADQFINHIKFNKKLLTSYPEDKSVILSFTTHDEISPIILHGERFSVMIEWLSATLPYNPYFVDGFQSGDDYLYSWANAQAKYTDTDYDYYFVHRGKLDIFNYSRKPGGNNEFVIANFKEAMKFRTQNPNLITKGTFSALKTDKEKVFAFSRSYQGDTIIVIGNLDFKHQQKRVSIKIPGLKKKKEPQIIEGLANFKTKNNKIITDLEAGEIKVLRMNNFAL